MKRLRQFHAFVRWVLAVLVVASAIACGASFLLPMSVNSDRVAVGLDGGGVVVSWEPAIARTSRVPAPSLKLDNVIGGARSNGLFTNRSWSVRIWWFDWYFGNLVRCIFVPMWIVLLAIALLTAEVWRRWINRRGFGCPECGYDMVGLAKRAQCPECGARG
jgi:hypothetical protein